MKAGILLGVMGTDVPLTDFLGIIPDYKVHSAVNVDVCDISVGLYRTVHCGGDASNFHLCECVEGEGACSPEGLRDGSSPMRSTGKAPIGGLGSKSTETDDDDEIAYFIMR